MSNEEAQAHAAGGQSVLTDGLGGIGQISAVIIPFVEPKEQKCSFCGKPKSVTAHFWTGAGKAAICGSCVLKAKQRSDSVPPNV